jgi:hypothetical protein
MKRLDAEWHVIARSWWFRRRLHAWAADDPRLAFDDGASLVEAARRDDDSSWADRDQVLAALLDRFANDPLARRVALQVVLPGIKSLVNGIRVSDIEERRPVWSQPHSRYSPTAPPNQQGHRRTSECSPTPEDELCEPRSESAPSRSTSSTTCLGYTWRATAKSPPRAWPRKSDSKTLWHGYGIEDDYATKLPNLSY